MGETHTHDVADSESAIVGSLLQQGEGVAAIIAAAGLAGRHFSCRWRGAVLDAALALAGRGVVPDVSTVYAELRDHDVPPPEGANGWGVALAAELDAALPLCEANVAWHCERIGGAAVARLAAAKLRQAAEAADEGDLERAAEICGPDLTSGLVGGPEAKDLLGDWETVMRGGVRCFKTKTFEELNAPEYGVLRSGLVTIGAEANTGKSSLASAIMLDVLGSDPDALGVLYSLDDSVAITGRRVASQLLGRNLFQAADGEIAADECAETLRRIFVRDQFSVKTVEGEVRALLRRRECARSVVVLDYLQIVQQPQGWRGDRREFFNSVVKELKEAQKRLEAAGHDCLVLLLSQLSRADGGQTYRYRETSEIENQSDVCLDLGYRMRDATEEEQRRLGTGRKQVPDLASPERVIRVTKNKLGKKGVEFCTEIAPDFRFVAPTVMNEAFSAKKKITDELPGRLGGR